MTIIKNTIPTEANKRVQTSYCGGALLQEGQENIFKYMKQHLSQEVKA